MAGKTLLYEETTKRVYKTDREDQILQEFTDSALLGKDAKKGRVKNKGMLNTAISAYLFEYLDGYNIPTHFIEKTNDREMLVRNVEVIPVNVIIHNLAAGSLCERYDVEEGRVLKYPMAEYFLKDESLNNPLISESFLSAFEHATPEEMRHMSRLAFKINAVLKDYFERRKIMLVDFLLKFGRYQNQVYLANEISPDTCRLWEIQDDDAMDKERFKLTSGTAEKVFRELYNRMIGS